MNNVFLKLLIASVMCFYSIFNSFSLILRHLLAVKRYFCVKFILNMKKYFYYLTFLILVTSCTEDVKFNNPAFQTLKDNVFWRGRSYTAETQTNGVFLIEGALGYENVSFVIPQPVEKTYILGIDNTAKATYKNTLSGQEAEFTTGQGRGSGQIIITEYNTVENTISGTFKFNAINIDPAAEKQNINFSEGVFYKIPVGPGHQFTAN